MQRTRFNTLIDNLLGWIQSLFSNPWRQIALNLISLLLGGFMGTAIITTFGQAAGWDLVGAATLILFTETVSRFVYHRNLHKKNLWLGVLNLFKIGLTYSLFIEAFKLGS